MLDSNFINKYKEMREFCVRNNLIVYVHGTHRDTDSILASGLNAIRADLSKTAFCFGYTETDMNIEAELEFLQNYRFPGSDIDSFEKGPIKNFVILGIPTKCNYFFNYDKNEGNKGLATSETKPVWAPIVPGSYSDELHVGEYAFKVTLLPEFILCSIDISKKEIKNNDLFKIEHDYSGLLYDYGSFPYTVCESSSEIFISGDIIDNDDFSL